MLKRTGWSKVFQNMTFIPYPFRVSKLNEKLSVAIDQLGPTDINKRHSIPMDFQWLLEKAAAQLGVNNHFAELLITEYPAGAVINSRRDASPFKVAGISLLSECTFRFRPFDKKKQARINHLNSPTKAIAILIERDARVAWQHSITPVNATRYSITLRTLQCVNFYDSTVMRVSN